MRKREDIERDGTRKDILMIEVLLDIRQLLQLAHKPAQAKRKPGKKPAKRVAKVLKE